MAVVGGLWNFCFLRPDLTFRNSRSTKVIDLKFSFVTLSEFIATGKSNAHRFNSPAGEAWEPMNRKEESTMQFDVLLVILLF
jgi:hypothetical protein